VTTPGHCKRFSNDTTISLFWGFNNEVEHVKEKLNKESSQFNQPPPCLFFWSKKLPKVDTKMGLATCLLYNVGPKSWNFASSNGHQVARLPQPHDPQTLIHLFHSHSHHPLVICIAIASMLLSH